MTNLSIPESSINKSYTYQMTREDFGWTGSRGVLETMAQLANKAEQVQLQTADMKQYAKLRNWVKKLDKSVNYKLGLYDGTRDKIGVLVQDLTTKKDYDKYHAKIKNFIGISENAFEKEQDHLAIFGGHLRFQKGKDWYGKESIFIAKQKSYVKGFGTAATRFLFKVSLRSGCEGRLYNDAVGSSHLFHLYMGMVPVEQEEDYIKLNFGEFGSSALENLTNISNKILLNEQLTPEEEGDLNSLKAILGKFERKDPEQITAQMVVDPKNQKKFEEISKKTVSYIRNKFTPTLLKILERDQSKKRPDTSSLRGVHMVLSDEGIKRWEQAVLTHQPFQPFKDLGHLRPLMRENQVKQLNEILDARENSTFV